MPTCPHGVDTSLHMTHEYRDGEYVAVGKFNECLRCTEAAGHIVLVGVTKEILNADR